MTAHETSSSKSADKIHLFFRSSYFFERNFPFHIKRFRHTPDDFNETHLCQREFWKIIYVISGRGWKVINGCRYSFKAGSLFLIHPHDETTFIITSRHIDIYNLLFMPETIADEIDRLRDDFGFFSILDTQMDARLKSDKRNQLHVIDSNREIKSLFARIGAEYKREERHYRNVLRLQLAELLILVCRLALKKAKTSQRRNMAGYISSAIDRHYQDKFDFDRLAKELGVGKSHMSRLFRTATGGTISQALRDRRVAAAKELLSRCPEKNISEICFACGFNDLSYFYRVFRAATDSNPGNYRKKFGLH